MYEKSAQKETARFNSQLKREEGPAFIKNGLNLNSDPLSCFDIDFGTLCFSGYSNRLIIYLTNQIASI